MTTRAQLAILALLIVLLLVFALFPRSAASDAPVVSSAVPQSELVPVNAGAGVGDGGGGLVPPVEYNRPRTPGWDAHGPGSASTTPSPSASKRVPTPTPVSRHPVGRQSASSGATPATGPTAPSVTGQASWYCGHGSACTRGYPASGMYAAAGPALRVGDWRGRVVTVTAGGRQVAVKLIDVCACTGGRVLDLYSSAFSRLAPLSRGVVEVSVRW